MAYGTTAAVGVLCGLAGLAALASRGPEVAATPAIAVPTARSVGVAAGTGATTIAIPTDAHMPPPRVPIELAGATRRPSQSAGPTDASIGFDGRRRPFPQRGANAPGVREPTTASDARGQAGREGGVAFSASAPTPGDVDRPATGPQSCSANCGEP